MSEFHQATALLRKALREMLHTVAKRNSFTDCVDEIDAFLSFHGEAIEDRIESKREESPMGEMFTSAGVDPLLEKIDELKARIGMLEAENKKLREQLATELVYGPDRSSARDLVDEPCCPKCDSEICICGLGSPVSGGTEHE